MTGNHPYLVQGMAKLMPISFFAVLAATITLPATAQDQTVEASGNSVVQDMQAKDGEPYFPSLLDGTLGVAGDLGEDESERRAFLRMPTMLDPWFAWKRSLREEYGLAIGGSFQLLGQHYSNSNIDLHNSLGSKFTLNIAYELFNRNQPDAMTFEVALEDRRPLGSRLAPLQAGLGTGSIVPTAATYGQFDLGISQAFIRQNLFNNRFQYTIGKIFAPNFIDAYPFFDDNRQFLSQQFSTSPTIASALRGFGMVAALYPTDSGLYFKPGVFTNHSDDTGSTVGDFINKNERFYMFEAGLSGLARSGVPIQGRAAMDSDNIHLTGWYRDPQDSPTMQRAYGVAFNANYRYGSNLMWFTRAGWSQGWVSDRAVSIGAGWRPTDHPADLFGVGTGWTRPAFSFLRSQYTSEIFYRFHVTPNLAVTPDVQYIKNPSLNPGTSSLWVLSVRARISF